MKKERYPSLSWKRDDIVTWLEDKGETVNPRHLKIRLLEVAQKYKQPENNYIIDEYAQQHGCTVVRIPPYHYELNLIEFAWANVKEYIRARNTTYKLADVRQLVVAAIENMSAENWQDFIRHTVKEEERLFKLDHITDSVLEGSPEWSNPSDI
ncbi:uncharacterized protein LOC143214369 [Lasioglossum baleicum]|uniref:uncharacterized protein LOC143214369 n=1 Tax=Lasioglossum baleicum TaxID=434251 RepID=UPI003FCDAF87